MDTRHNFLKNPQPWTPTGCCTAGPVLDAPVTKNGYMFVNEASELGIDIDKKEAAKYPLPELLLIARANPLRD